ncbi:MAG: alpha/beta hydrolase [Dehalococcoidales bacterium]|nr:alpha/beta hydrolase [Dehalococcoidales bacterium]
MKNIRKYGNKPLNLAVIHGGPGASGEMAPVAQELSLIRGVLEPLQTAASIDGQVEELAITLKECADLPVILIGSSWGAMLSFIFAARYPSFVAKLILIGSGAYEDKYAQNIMETRLTRLSKEENTKIFTLIDSLNNPAITDKNTLMSQLGQLISRADSYDPLTYDNNLMECNYNIYQNVWRQASDLRSSGKLLEFGKNIQCPVLAIHGDYDPHLYQGVQEPLSRVIKDFRFILLENCGHHPWIERGAKDQFYDMLRNEV